MQKEANQPDIAEGVTETVEQKWEENSPSKKAIQRGEWFSEGLAEGIENKQSDVEQRASETAMLALEQISSYVQPLQLASWCPLVLEQRAPRK